MKLVCLLILIVQGLLHEVNLLCSFAISFLDFCLFLFAQVQMMTLQTTWCSLQEGAWTWTHFDREKLKSLSLSTKLETYGWITERLLMKAIFGFLRCLLLPSSTAFDFDAIIHNMAPKSAHQIKGLLHKVNLLCSFVISFMTFAYFVCTGPMMTLQTTW